MSIRRIEDIVCEYSGRYQAWSLLQETPIPCIQSLGYAVCVTLEVTAAKVSVTAAKQNLVLFSNLNEKYAK
ncbi:hypothetical protein Tco_0890305 [Tanacetum coccineum]|uniref:Uncharacterized protein n=1 Tax=Tanacetum coccineum TaxID=301880 RepID=A0ABQ5C2U5_9ASTR